MAKPKPKQAERKPKKQRKCFGCKQPIPSEEDAAFGFGHIFCSDGCGELWLFKTGRA